MRDLNPTSILGSPALCCMPDVTVNTTPQALPNPDHGVAIDGVEEVMLQNDPGSASTVLVGDSVNQTMRIVAGASIVIPCRKPSLINVVIGAGSATLHVLYRGQLK